MATRDPTVEVLEAMAEIGEMVVDLREQEARFGCPRDKERVKTLLGLLQQVLLALPSALSTWRANPTDDAEVWGYLDNWDDVKTIMSPSLSPAPRRPRRQRRRR